MNTGLARRGRFALGGVTLVALGWAAAPWIFCTETWAADREPPAASAKCPYEQPPVQKRVRSLRESAPPLAPFVA